MKKRNRNQLKERNGYPYSDSTALAEYLCEKAEEGWLLTECRGQHFLYEKAQAQQLRYHVDFARSKAPGYDYIAAKQELQEYKERCAALGWRYVCRAGSLHILAAQTQDAAPPPMDCGGRQALSAALSNDSGIYLYRCLLLPFVYFLLWGLDILWGNSSLFSDSGLLLPCMAWLIGTACMFWSAGRWLRWYFSNKKRVNNGLPVVFRSKKDRARDDKRSALLLCLPGLLLAAFAAAAWAAGDKYPVYSAAGGTVLLLNCALLVGFSKKEKRSKKIVLAVAAIGFTVSAALWIGGSMRYGNPDEPPPAPLTAQDFGIANGRESLYYPRGNQTFLAQSYRYDPENMSFYEIRRSKYRPIFAYMRAELHLQYRWLRKIPINPAWEAEKAYSNGEETIVIFEDTILIYDSKAKPSDEQIRVIAEKLAVFVRDSLRFT